ncbi:helix-turn-helix domain-containing protein [Paenibacillus sp. LMG 31458]|uniref:Helix-turn-helix domain-containing protein n=1 Tax=Paenibacillus phytorum TaxID=2654977 RepID=A0ABX1XXD9_9BACL|nr:helix-turn-helix transcriptional regulator [Paenibacillus phytorum]NOU73192.1 helix-turn-helix domain-containing protein [Paenibacillus phytorum]
MCDKAENKNFAYFDKIIVTVLKALYYMRQLEDLRVNRDMGAATFNISSGYFSECFKTIIGRSFGEYMKALQIEKAKRLLVETKYPIYRIAEQTGYKDEKYFSKIFRERAGMNPAEYRKANEGSVETK